LKTSERDLDVVVRIANAAIARAGTSETARAPELAAAPKGYGR